MKKWLKKLFKSNKTKHNLKRDDSGRWVTEDNKTNKKLATLPLENKWSEAKGRINKCHCKPGTCGCSSKTSPQKPSTVKPDNKQVEKREAIKKDVAETPKATNKPSAKKPPKKN